MSASVYDYMNSAGIPYASASGFPSNAGSGYGQPSPYDAFFQQVMGQYGNLQGQVQGQIAGIGRSQAQAIKDTYAQQQAQATQDLTSRGLGNTTVTSSVQRGLTYDEQKAQIALQDQLAQLQAGYTSQLGMSQLGFEGQYVGQQQQLAQQRALQTQQLGSQQSIAQLYASRGYGYGGGGAAGPYGQQLAINPTYNPWAGAGFH